MKWCLYSIAFSCLLIAHCKSDGSAAELDAMKKLVWDLQRTEDFVVQYAVRDSAINQDSLLREKFAQVFALHKISEPEFLKTMNSYRQQPVLMRRLMDSVFQYGTRYRETAILPDSSVKPVKKMRQKANEESL